VAPIRDPDLDREQTSKNVSTTISTYERERQVVKDQDGRAGWKERGLRGTKAGSVERAACPIHLPGENAPAQNQNQDLAEISRSSKGAP
jgi:hypothetical protein